MRVRRAHHDGVNLTRQVFVGGVAAGPAHETQVFPPG